MAAEKSLLCSISLRSRDFSYSAYFQGEREENRTSPMVFVHRLRLYSGAKGSSCSCAPSITGNSPVGETRVKEAGSS